MPTIFRSSVKDKIGNLETLVTVQPGVKVTVIGYNVVNVTNELVTINSYVIDNDTPTFYVKDLLIPPQTTVKLVTNGEKLILDTDSLLQIESNRPDSIDVTVSYVEIS
jgi:hypothetical protein